MPYCSNGWLPLCYKCTSNGFVILNVEYVKGKLVVYVADSGIGMSEAQIQRFNLSEMKFGNTELFEHMIL